MLCSPQPPGLPNADARYLCPICSTRMGRISSGSQPISAVPESPRGLAVEEGEWGRPGHSLSVGLSWPVGRGIFARRPPQPRCREESSCRPPRLPEALNSSSSPRVRETILAMRISSRAAGAGLGRRCTAPGGRGTPGCRQRTCPESDGTDPRNKARAHDESFADLVQPLARKSARVRSVEEANSRTLITSEILCLRLTL